MNDKAELEYTFPSILVQLDTKHFEGFEQMEQRSEKPNGTVVQKFLGASHERLIALEERFVHERHEACCIENIGEANELSNGMLELVFMTDDKAYLPDVSIEAVGLEDGEFQNPLAPSELDTR